MSPPRSRDPAWIGALGRVYAATLHLYPRAHRERWGGQMRLAFRDRCREAARAGRGPWSVAFAEWLPDLAASAGREHIESLAGLTPMKRMLLFALLFAFGATLVFRAQLGDAVVAARDAWQQYQVELDARALRGHEAALAAAVEQRGGTHDDVIAAQLYWAAGMGLQRRFPADSGLHLTAAETAASDALLDRADAAFSKATRANDVWALWLAANASSCPARTPRCGADEAFERLRQVDKDNGAVWALAMQRASVAGDVTRERAALAQLAQATRFDWHFADSMHGMLSAFALRPLPHRLQQSYDHGGKAPEAESATLFAGWLGSSNGTVSMTAYQPLAHFCNATDPGARAERASDCRAAGRLLADRGVGLIDAAIGSHIGLGNATPEERTQMVELARNAQWRLQQAARVAPERSADATRRWRAAWMSSGTETEVYDRLLRERGIGLQAPADFKPASNYSLPADTSL